MEKIIQKVKKYNDAVAEFFNGDDYHRLHDLVSATDEEIGNMEKVVGFTIPKELNDFYKHIGRVQNTMNFEVHCLCISEPKEIVPFYTKSFSSSDSDRALSFGLIDIIVEHWGFNRPEFQNFGEYMYSLTEKETDYINANYKCFGYWRNDDILEGAYFLFFDKKGNFGEIYYHQDEFDDIGIELKKLIKNGLVDNRSLEDILSNALEVARETMIDWN